MKTTAEEKLKKKFSKNFLDVDYIDLIIEAMEEYASIKEDKWISVEERLPNVENKDFNDSGYCICLDINISIEIPFVAWYNHGTKIWTVAHHYATNEAVKVTHWLLLSILPSPPKEEK